MPDELARGSGAANSEGSRGKGGRSSRGNKAYATAFRDSGMEAPPKVMQCNTAEYSVMHFGFSYLDSVCSC